MTRLKLPLAVAALVFLGSLLTSGCSSPPTHFYVLSSIAAPVPAAGDHDVAVGVGPLEFPDYLDRPQIVTRTGQNELDLADLDNWAEPLKDNATQVVAENLATLLSSKRVVTYPWKRATAVEFQVAAKVIRFDCTQGGDAVLSARWHLADAEGKEIYAGESRYTERAAEDNYSAKVAAMSRALSAFSRDVAAAINARSKSRF